MYLLSEKLAVETANPRAILKCMYIALIAASAFLGGLANARASEVDQDRYREFLCPFLPATLECQVACELLAEADKNYNRCMGEAPRRRYLGDGLPDDRRITIRDRELAFCSRETLALGLAHEWINEVCYNYPFL